MFESLCEVHGVGCTGATQNEQVAGEWLLENVQICSKPFASINGEALQGLIFPIPNRCMG